MSERLRRILIDWVYGLITTKETRERLQELAHSHDE